MAPLAALREGAIAEVNLVGKHLGACEAALLAHFFQCSAPFERLTITSHVTITVRALLPP